VRHDLHAPQFGRRRPPKEPPTLEEGGEPVVPKRPAPTLEPGAEAVPENDAAVCW
jgi:hypothetical protein